MCDKNNKPVQGGRLAICQNIWFNTIEIVCLIKFYD